MRFFGGQQVKQVQPASGKSLPAEHVPKTPNPSLGHFGAYSSKAQFMVDWAADIFRQTGKNPNHHAAGVQEMANIATFTQIWYRLRAGAASNDDRRSIKYLESFDQGNLLVVLDTMYPTAMQHIAKGAGCWSGPMTNIFISNFDNTFDEVFVSCRTEFVEGVLKGDF
jgi:hypothetical protein